MPSIVVIYHSGFGHTKAVAESVAKGAHRVEGTNVTLVNVDDLGRPNEDHELGPEWGVVHSADAIIMGCPTYMGTVSAEFKRFMDSSSVAWLTQSWRDKIAAGFTNAGALSGDKLNTLTTLAVFAAQHSMVWVSQGVHMEPGEKEINRMGSYLGMMAQSGNASPETTPPESDHETARRFGSRVAQATHQWVSGRD